MRAKCPYCDNGCDKCKKGYLEVSFETGYIFTIKCQNPECGFENGMRIDKRENFDKLVLPVIKCVKCDGETRYLKIGNTSDYEGFQE